MIKFANLKFLHRYIHNKLPLSFHETWVFNRDQNINRVLRNANELFVPAHHFATLKRLPLFTFPRLWNEEEDRKFSVSHSSYCKKLKMSLLASLVDLPFFSYVSLHVNPPSPPPPPPHIQAVIYRLYSMCYLLGLDPPGLRNKI